MEKITKTQRERHDIHDLIIGILYTFPVEAKWDELRFHEALKKHYDNSIVKIEFGKIDENIYAQDVGKIFDLLELSGVVSRKHEKTRIDIELLQGHFDEEIKPTLNESEIQKIDRLSKKIQEELKITWFGEKVLLQNEKIFKLEQARYIKWKEYY